VVGRLPAELRGAAVVFDTGWTAHWGSDRYLRHPFLSGETCRELVTLGVGLVGTDALNVDDTAGGSGHAHWTLLGADVLIVENLANPDQLVPGRRYRFAFAPLLLPGVDGSPVRAFAWQE
jgi:kynurenine formamidase